MSNPSPSEVELRNELDGVMYGFGQDIFDDPRYDTVMDEIMLKVSRYSKAKAGLRDLVTLYRECEQEALRWSDNPVTFEYFINWLQKLQESKS